MTNPTTIILYHGGGCMDGYASAWVASQSLGRGPEIAYIPMNYGDPLPPITPDGSVKAIYLLDFSVARDAMRFLAGLAETVICLDHHKTAQAELAGLDGTLPGLKIVFDMERSGAMLTWDHFHPGKPAPFLVQLIQDRDLWLWKIDDSKPLNTALASYSRTFDTWDWLVHHIESMEGQSELRREGMAILRSQSAQIEGLAAKATMVNVGGYQVPAVNTPLYQSEIGERLCQLHPDAPFAACYFDMTPKGNRVWSLRSRNGFDVSEVARANGGGGHAAAAGFVEKRNDRIDAIDGWY